jgi:hypothetical protein
MHKTEHLFPRHFGVQLGALGQVVNPLTHGPL